MRNRLVSIPLISSFVVLHNLLLLFLVEETRALALSNLTFQSAERLHQLQDVKDRILFGLHLKDVPILPHGLKRPAVQKALSQLHDATVFGNGNYNYPESVAFILFSEPAGLAEEKNLLDFRLNGQSNEKYIQVRSASLFMRVRKKKKKKKKKTTNPLRKRQHKLKVLVHRFDKKKGKYKRMALMKFKVKKTKWLKLDMPTWTVENDINSGNKTIRLRLSCKRCTNAMTLDLLYKRRRKKKEENSRKKKSAKRKLSQTRPFLVVHTIPSLPTRSGRSTEDCPQTVNQTDCCSRPLYVDFREIGWDNWVIYPSGFTTSTCYGGCSNTVATSATCSATTTEPLSVVYYRRRNVIVRATIPDLIHRGCSCR